MLGTFLELKAPMKNFITFIAIAVVFTAFELQALEVDLPTTLPQSYVVVGVSGLKTGRSKEDAHNIFSKELGPTMESSGAWNNLPTRHKKIVRNAYLTHFSTDEEINAVLNLTLDQNNNCRENLGLIMLVNSWGAITSQKLAKQYLKKCKKLPLLTILIEGVSKPTPFPYRKSLLAHNCVNFYQTQSSLQGGSIENCKNYEIDYSSSSKSLFNTHIHAEWEGSEKGKVIIEDFMSGKLPLLFVKEIHGIDNETGL